MGTLIKLVGEEYVPSAGVYNPVSLKFGLSDSVIHKLAESGILVLTDDLPLYGLLSTLGYDAINFNHIRAEYLLK